MCTAIDMKNRENVYFGRTLDVEVDYKTSVVIAPRNFPFNEEFKTHYAIIGMAMVMDDYPLYFDGTNEMGLSMAGLNFPGNAHYFEPFKNAINLAPYELIPYILGKCKNVKEARKTFEKINIVTRGFKNIPNSPLHWIVCDENEGITVEQTEDGLKIFENKVGVLTNNPTFDWHMTNLTNYMNITPEEGKNRMLSGVTLKAFCKGMGGIGLPGDLSSPSRFVRVAFAKNRAVMYDDEGRDVSQFFHVLGCVEQTTGLARAGDSYEMTLYTSCVNATKGIYYYKTYFNSAITAVDMRKENLDGSELCVHPVDYRTYIKID